MVTAEESATPDEGFWSFLDRRCHTEPVLPPPEFLTADEFAAFMDAQEIPSATLSAWEPGAIHSPLSMS
jgi:hypothetical protein